jgi:hypothetical protein
MKIKKLAVAVVAIAALSGAVSACGSDTQGAGHPRPNASEQGHGEPVGEPSTIPPAPEDEPSEMDLTKVAVDAVWDNATEADKNDMCDAIDMFGKDFAEDAMREGAGDDSYLIDWDRAATMYEKKCDARG